MVFILNFIFVVVCATLLAASGQEQCSHPADIVFLVDDSRSIWGPDFRKELDFVRYLVGQFEVSENKTRVALATFSEGVREQFPLWKFNSASQIQLVVDQIVQYNGGTTDIFAALRYARENLFKDARPNVPHIIILITDGVSQRENETLTEATLTKAKGIDILVIGVGSMDVRQLKLMASQPAEDFFFTVSNFPDLTNIKSLVATQACQGDATECKTKPSEVVFVLDKSSSIYILDFHKQLKFVSDVIDIFDIGVNKTRVAAVSFSTNATVEFHLDEFSTKQDIKDSIAKVNYTGGITATGLALMKVRDEVLSPAHGFRSDLHHRWQVTKLH
ncbi:hypothetical protein Btru_051673 [Bulinus truncatus]|nr:hypothetical protein Btru_051673 [Bulinus truncatus]